MGTTTSSYRGSKEYLLVYAELLQAARYRGVITYQTVAEIMGLPLTGNYMGKEVGQLIGEISQDEVQNGRPMLSALVVGVSGVPGEGFLTWAKELGRLTDDSKEARAAFWESEKQAVYQAWARTFKA